MSEDISRILLWRSVIRCSLALLLGIALCITAYEIAYLYKVKPQVTPSYVWPTTPGSMN